VRCPVSAAEYKRVGVVNLELNILAAQEGRRGLDFPLVNCNAAGGKIRAFLTIKIFDEVD